MLGPTKLALALYNPGESHLCRQVRSQHGSGAKATVCETNRQDNSVLFTETPYLIKIAKKRLAERGTHMSVRFYCLGEKVMGHLFALM